MEYVNDVSVIDETLYSYVNLGASTANTYRFFLDSVGTVGKKRTNLTVGGQLPANWSKFVVYGMAFRFMGEVTVDDYITFMRDSYFTLRIADNPIKQDHLSILSPLVASLLTVTTQNYATTPAVNIDYIVNHTITDKQGGFFTLEKGYEIEIPSQASFQIELVSGSNVSSFQNKIAGFLLRGYLKRKING